MLVAVCVATIEIVFATGVAAVKLLLAGCKAVIVAVPVRIIVASHPLFVLATDTIMVSDDMKKIGLLVSELVAIRAKAGLPTTLSGSGLNVITA